MIGFPVTLAVVALASGAFPVACILLFFAALGGYIIYLWRDKIGMAAQLISVSANSIRQNPGIVWISIGLQIASLLVSVVLLGFIFAAIFGDSRAVPNKNLLPGTDGVKADGCMGHPIVCSSPDVEDNSDEQECHVDTSVVQTVPCCQ